MNWYKKSRTNILDCDDCGKSTLCEGYMLKNNIWMSIADKNTNLCIDCVEKRLKRQLTKNDFMPIDYNFWEGMEKSKSPKLLDRLGKPIVHRNNVL